MMGMRKREISDHWCKIIAERVIHKLKKLPIRKEVGT